MNCLENIDTIYHFVNTISVGDKLVMYPLHIPRPEKVSAWGTLDYVYCTKTLVLCDDESYIFRGNAPVFVEVNSIGNWQESDTRKIRTIYFKPVTISQRMTVKLHMHFRYHCVTEEWDYVIFAAYYVTTNDSCVVNHRIIFRQSTIGMFRRNAFCESIISACERHTKRAVMREYFSKKMGDARAVDMIAYSFFPLL